MPLDEAAALWRLALVYVHLLAFALAAGAIALGDLAVFAGRRPDAPGLARAGRVVATALVVLWASGLGLIGLDTGFDPVVLLGRDKLLAKLSVVTLLSLNGVALHRIAFPRLRCRSGRPMAAAWWPALLGAVSAVSWLYAALLGVGKALAPLLGYGGFIALYAAALVIGAALSLAFVRPRLARRLAAPENGPDDFAPTVALA